MASDSFKDKGHPFLLDPSINSFGRGPETREFSIEPSISQVQRSQARMFHRQLY